MLSTYHKMIIWIGIFVIIALCCVYGESYINIGDSWENVSEVYVNVGDSWKQVGYGYINIGDSWKQIYP